MNELPPRFREIFFELFGSLPRQGPGNRACAERALRLCRALPSEPDALDLGCGTGAQTLHLAELTRGAITAMDLHAPAIDRLNGEIARRGLAHRVRAIRGDMAEPGFPPERFDLVWSEGALYQVGIPKAMAVCRRLLRPGGHLAFTDAVWRRPDPPPEVKAGFESDYPGMGRVEDVERAIRDAGFELLGRFTLPDEAWWEDFYTPMIRRIEELRERHAGDAEAAAALDRLAAEPGMHRRHSEFYAYEFFVARRAPA